tara:strand:+ start:85 stop:705 length:621 start_codon:yes stop_codon:yes gene_type:complete
MSKLDNVKAVNQMIRGEHKTQTRTSKGYVEKSIERKVGDSWVDKNGQEWIQKNGYKAKVAKFNKIRNIANPDTCPKCNKVATRFDKQFLSREGKCHDCILKEETLMVCEGYVKKQPIYEQYERKKIRQNVESFLKDAKKDVELLKQRFTREEYVNSDGSIDKWSLPESVESINNSLDKQFDKFKEQLLNQLEQGDKNVGIKNTTTE